MLLCPHDINQAAASWLLTVSIASAMALIMASCVRALAERRNCFNLLHIFSIGFNQESMAVKTKVQRQPILSIFTVLYFCELKGYQEQQSLQS